MAGGGWRISESGERAARPVEIPETDSGAVGDEAGESKILGTARAFGSRGSVPGSGLPLGLDHGNDETCGPAGEGTVLIRAYRIGNADGSRGGGGSDARGRIAESGGLGARESKFIEAERVTNPMGCGRRTDVCKARGATWESIRRYGARSTEVRARSRWRNLEVGRVTSGAAGCVRKGAQRIAGFYFGECVHDGADVRASRKRSGSIACLAERDAQRVSRNDHRRRAGVG